MAKDLSQKKSSPAIIYFQRVQKLSDEITLSRCWLTFKQIADDFAFLFEKWTEKRESLGPGIYMYLGLRRGFMMYSENRFINMIWGLEALHRKSSVGRKNVKLEQKIERIIAQINGTSDRRWLTNQLRNSSEPRLESRIIETLSEIKLPLEIDRLRRFAGDCVKYRNDLSHFGTVRGGLLYDDFILKLNLINEALEVLYHFKILQEIGVNEQLIKWIFEDGFQSHRIKYALWSVGLLEQSPHDVAVAKAQESLKKIGSEDK